MIDTIFKQQIKMFVADAAGTVHQRRVYPKRRAKSAIHHRRMQKKWLKRYGTYIKPAMYWVHPRSERLATASNHCDVKQITLSTTESMSQ